MDQLHEELKEPLTECSMSGEGSDGDERRDGDRSPSEDEFLSCDSGSSSDRGEGGGLGEGELLLQDECDGFRSPSAGVGSGMVISEKERLKERRVSGSPLRGGSQEMDEDADVDTAAEDGAPERGEEEPPAPIANTDVHEDNQTTTAGQVQSNNASGSSQDYNILLFMLSHSFINSYFWPPCCCLRARQRSINDPAAVHPLQSCPNPAGASSQAVVQSATLQPAALCRTRTGLLLQER